jgi:hypothetical protein
MRYRFNFLHVLAPAALVLALRFQPAPDQKWESRFIKVNANGTLTYIPDEKGNMIPDFSYVGYYGGDKPIPQVPVVKTLSPSDNDRQTIQSAIDELSRQSPDANGIRGAILLKKGVY